MNRDQVRHRFTVEDYILPDAGELCCFFDIYFYHVALFALGFPALGYSKAGGWSLNRPSAEHAGSNTGFQTSGVQSVEVQ